MELLDHAVEEARYRLDDSLNRGLSAASDGLEKNICNPASGESATGLCCEHILLVGNPDTFASWPRFQESLPLPYCRFKKI
jgi:hypothetical protein